MKRDMELIRKMVLAVEDAPTGYAPDPLKIEGYTDEQVRYHAYQLIDGEYAKGPIVSSSGSSSPQAIILSLTWKGHDFAAVTRDETTWRKVMTVVRQKGGAVTLDVVKALASKFAKSSLGLDE